MFGGYSAGRLGSGVLSSGLVSVAYQLWSVAVLAVIELSGAGFPTAPILAHLEACMMPAARFHHSLHLPTPSYLVLSRQASSH
jgi:hypothetical protein